MTANEDDTLQIPVLYYVNIWYVPAGAVSNPEICSVQVTQGTNSSNQPITRYDFGPEGLEFNQSTYLTHNTAAPNNTPVELWWFNPANSAWELVRLGSIKDGKIVFPIDHFSIYSIWEGSTSNGAE